MNDEMILKFSSNVRKTKSCWLWTAGKDGHGYGNFYHKGKKYRSHRLAYRMWVGGITKAYDVHHKCKNILCVRPTHLKKVLHGKHFATDPVGICAVNMRRKVCKNGHRLTGSNVYRRPSRPNARECKQCKLDGNRRAYGE